MKLGDLVNWNPWWKGRLSAIENWQKYYNYSFISNKNPLNFSKNYIIRGPRQVGKTVFLYRMMNETVEKGISSPEGITYISCDRLGGRKELRNLLKELKEIMRDKDKNRFLFLDEITSIKEWEKVYKEICEEEFFKVVATGSRPRELEKSAEYFPGREVEIYNFYPLSFKEFVKSLLISWLSDGKFGILNIDRYKSAKSIFDFFEKRKIRINTEMAKNLLDTISSEDIITSEIFNINLFKKLAQYFEIIQFLFRVYMEAGGYPVVIEAKIKEEKSLPTELIIKDTLGTIEKEGLNSEILNRLIPNLLENLSSIVTYSELAKELGIDTVTLIRYIEILEKSFILREIFFFDGEVHPKKGKKFFFSDPFIFRAFQEYYGVKEIDKGKIVEGIVGEHLIRWIEDPFRSYWKYKIGYGRERKKEIDFIVKTNKGILKIEVKYRETISEFLKNIDFILTKEDFEVSKRPYKIPVPIFLLGL